MSDHDILKQPIKTDILEHFIKHITMLQDWERIMVWEYDTKNGSSAPKLSYCYKHFDSGKWEKCDNKENAKCHECKPSLNKLQEWIKENGMRHLPINREIKNAKQKALLENIFNKRLIPELYDNDVNKYKDTRLIFEYPCYTVFPKDENKLGLHYERQQIDLLSQMALQLKVKQETIKHGTKSAILSIDVRNLSHNIGSHVLAYWLQELKKLADEAGLSSDNLKKAINKSIALFRYIQHRADFLAEVATSIPCSEMSFDLKKEILNPFLNDGKPDNPYTERKDPLTGNSNIDDGIQIDSNVYVLLRYIADSEGITINFDATNKTKKIIQYKCKKKAPRVSIPSGIIGKHAIYSILENFIRNAAKHYKGTETTVNGNFIKIKVSKPETEEAWKDDYVAVEIIDVRKNSCDCEIVQKLNLFKNGSFVKEDGSLESGGWGIKEMLISANFLRKNTPEYLYDVITGRKTCNPPLLEIVCKASPNEACDNKNCCKECETDYNLAIRFYLKKPKHLAVMVDSITEGMINKGVFEIKK